MDIDAVIRDIVRVEVERALAERGPTDWIPHTLWPTTTTTRDGRPYTRRSVELARSGRVKCRKVGKVWMARRVDLDSFIASQPTAEPSAVDDPIAEILQARK